MTAQIDDMFRYRNAIYSVSGISAGELFDPSILELSPAMASTACWRGYQATYSLQNARLVVADLQLNLIKDEENYHRKQGPSINGVSPTGSASCFFNNHYQSLNYHLEYSGGILIAEGFIRELYVHMGFHPAWKYKTVFELIFANGTLVSEHDRSERMAQVREMIAAKDDTAASERSSSRDDIQEFVYRAFDRTYPMD